MSAILALETGQVMPGTSIGANGICVGELVFNTAMTGYQEIISDPSYAQQIISFTCPHIGNTGINNEDFQSAKIHASGIIVKSLSTYVSNWRATSSLQEYLLQQNVVAISGIDTRGLTKILRKHGALRGCIMAGEIDPEKALDNAKKFSGLNGANLTTNVSCKQTYTINAEHNLHIVVIDYGIKDNIVQCLARFGYKITIVPAATTAEDILALNPNGIVLSNGPGDPKACTEIIANIKILLKAEIPIFGICLGHQLLALALGAKTYKMDYGHHGSNHPVQNIHTKQVLITSQNHGFAVKEASLNTNLEVTHRSLFDQTIQGFRHKHLPLFGFQGHPEAAPGPHEAKVLFNDFISCLRMSNA